MYKHKFIEKLGVPFDDVKLDMYIALCKQGYEGDEYSEDHHILPRCEFPEYASSDDNIVTLYYPDHVQAHRLLFEAYPTRKFQNPLRFMSDAKHGDLVSEAAKTGWRNFRETEKFRLWSLKRSAYMVKTWESDDYRIFMSSMSTFHNARPEVKVTKRKASRAMWVEKGDQIRATMAVTFNTPEVREQRRVKTTQRYHDEKFMSNFTDKMTVVNRDEKKRLSAGAKLKTLWSDEAYKEKMFAARSGIFWWNDGTTQVKSRDCPDGFVRGRLITPNLGRKKKNETN